MKKGFDISRCQFCKAPVSPDETMCRSDECRRAEVIEELNAHNCCYDTDCRGGLPQNG